MNLASRLQRAAAFTIFEMVLAMAVFMLAFGGLVMALDATISAGVETRSVSQMRRSMESRLAYCRVDPPPPNRPRVIEADENGGIKITESLEPYEAITMDEVALTGLWTLKMEAESGGFTTTAETLLYIP